MSEMLLHVRTLLLDKPSCCQKSVSQMHMRTINTDDDSISRRVQMSVQIYWTHAYTANIGDNTNILCVGVITHLQETCNHNGIESILIMCRCLSTGRLALCKPKPNLNLPILLMCRCHYRGHLALCNSNMMRFHAIYVQMSLHGPPCEQWRRV